MPSGTGTCVYHIRVLSVLYVSMLIERMFGDWQRKADIDGGKTVSVGVQYEMEDLRTASLTVVCKDCQVETGKLPVNNSSTQ